MTKRSVLGVLCAAALFASVFEAPAMAQPADKRTYFTFSQPVALPGVTLPAGTYMFRYVDSSRRVVQISSADGTKAYGMFLTLPTERIEPASQPELQFMETAEGMPAAAKAWWYPGDRIGSEFMFPKDQANRLARHAGQPKLTASIR